MSLMIAYYQSLGSSIELAWRAYNYNEEIFPQLVSDALLREPPDQNIDVKDIVSWVFSPSQIIQQPDGGGKLFGEPPIVLFQGPRFYIEALFWLSGTTDIHEHAFSGAFSVLSGSSVHSHWHFSPDRIVNSRMLIGQLSRASTEILRPGDVREIHSGRRLIHQLFHLEAPSVTIVVRTYQEKNRLPQYKYLPPGLAIDNENIGGLLARRLIFLRNMAQGRMAGLEECAVSSMEYSDIESAYYIISTLMRTKAGDGLVNEAYDIACRRHGSDVARIFRDVCEIERRTRSIVALRSKISNSKLRFLLALLMLMPNRAAIFEAVGIEVPGSAPLEVIETWLQGVAGKEFGFDFNEVNRLIFRGLVEGWDSEVLLCKLSERYSRESIEAQRVTLLCNAQSIGRSDVFFSLFSESPFRG